jgi:hypothetical protein
MTPVRSAALGTVAHRAQHLLDVERIDHLLAHRRVASHQRLLTGPELADPREAVVLVNEGVVELVAQLRQRSVRRKRRCGSRRRRRGRRSHDHSAERGVAHVTHQGAGKLHSL